MNPIIQMLMTQLRTQNPQGYNMLNQMMQSGVSPQQFLNQMVGNSNPQQMQQILQQAKQFGVPDNFLAQMQNMKKG